MKSRKKKTWKNVRNSEGRTIGQQRAKIRKDKEEALKEVSKEREETAMKKLDDSFFCDQLFIRGVYFLYRDNKIVYIGMSKDNVMDRVVRHSKEKKKVFSRFRIREYSELSDTQLLAKEKSLIKHWQPEYNVIHNFKEKVKRRKSASNEWHTEEELNELLTNNK